ncbi:MAG: OsmC family protein [Flavitalea sp.]
MKIHSYHTQVEWTGNTGKGTESYKSYERAHLITVDGKPPIAASSDPSFRGDKTRYNPEDLLVASLSSCHMLWYLHLCSAAGIIVESYTDNATGEMKEDADGGGVFTKVILKPAVTIKDLSKKREALELHHKANKLCFIANSVNFEVLHEPVIN